MISYAVVLPAGSGKSTLASKYNFLIDIDALHSKEFQYELRKLYKKTYITGDWHTYNAFECNSILPRLQNYTPNHILLVHCVEKATILGLTVLGIWKTSRIIMENVVKQRNDTRGIIMLNWESLQDAQILETHNDIENAILDIIKERNIILDKNNI